MIAMVYIKEVKDRENEVKPMVNMSNNDNMANDLPNFPSSSTLELLDSIMSAREELFENQLSKGLESHRKLANLMMK